MSPYRMGVWVGFTGNRTESKAFSVRSYEMDVWVES